MHHFGVPEEKKIRVILNTDLKNEVDDQFAVVHALLTESFCLKGIIPAHFGEDKSPHSMLDSKNEGLLLLEKMGLSGKVPFYDGAEHAMPDPNTPVDSEGARLIIREAMSDDPRPLFIAFLGPVTDIASAILLEPEICNRNVTIVWIGGNAWPSGGSEYNLKNDVNAANVLFKSTISVWQIPRNVYRMMPVSFAELYTRVHPYGEIGSYLAQNVIDYNNARRNIGEYRVLGDSPAIGVMLFEDCGQYVWRSAPQFDSLMHYVHDGRQRPIRVYENIDSRFIMEDFYAKLQLFQEDFKG